MSAAILSNASSVFKAMLKPRFKEGSALAVTTNAVEIPLPDDNARAMTIICQVMHLRNDLVHEVANDSTAMVLRVAELSDKYDCTIALEPTVRHWLACSVKVLSTTERQDLLTAAYYFGNGVAFADIGRSLLVDTSRSQYHLSRVGHSNNAAPLHKLFGTVHSL